MLTFSNIGKFKKQRRLTCQFTHGITLEYYMILEPTFFNKY